MKVFRKAMVRGNQISRDSEKEAIFPHPLTVRLAIYDNLLSRPRIKDFSSDDFIRFVDEVTSQIYQEQKAKEKVPYMVLREVIENLIHARFKDAVVSIYDDGNTISISDQGPGIKDKTKAFLPGFTTADSLMRRFIRGVGSGLPIVKETLQHLGGKIRIEDNLEGGTVVILSLSKDGKSAERPKEDEIAQKEETTAKPLQLSPRQKDVFLVVAEQVSAGPTKIAKELKISLATVHRELVALEAQGLVTCQKNGQRTLTEKGMNYLETIFNT